MMINWYGRFGKRLLDVMIAGGVVLGLAPLLLLIAALVKLTSRGPVFYVQQRIGRHGRPFPFIKFRTMIVGAERVGAGILCLKDDPRITPVGSLLRRFSLDELPQLINVVRGEMSVIGPRPGLAYQVQEYSEDQRRRLDVLPGITGWAQVNGRNAIPWSERIRFDLEYVDDLTLRMDLRILLRTVKAVLFRENLVAEKDYFKEQAARRQVADR
jgi:lipopolysaccharide/colanic/teichoic acid biosynthesis glycosyltransferase